MTCSSYFARTNGLNDVTERFCLFVAQSGGGAHKLSGPISVCTDYKDKNSPDKWEMEKIAWTLELSRKKVGFDTVFEPIFKAPKKREDE